jgi:hypothetical protein
MTCITQPSDFKDKHYLALFFNVSDSKDKHYLKVKNLYSHVSQNAWLYRRESISGI